MFDLFQGSNFKPLIGLEYGHVRDVYSFGVLFDELNDKLEELGFIVSDFNKCIEEKLMCENPKERWKLSELYKEDIFQ